MTFSPCCFFNAEKEYESIEQYWSSQELKELRQSFIDNKKHPGCAACWRAEDKGIKSMRQSVNESRLEKYKQRTITADSEHPPTQIKYTVGNQCNLSCRMCVPNSSSKVQQVWNTLGIEDPLSVDHFDWASYIFANYQSLEYIDITGGEPFYHKNTKKILQFLIDKEVANKITLYIQTNLTILDQTVIDQLNHFKKVVLRVSIDGVGKRQEYIRPGLDWNQFEQNIMKIKKEKFDVMISPSLNVLNICNFEEIESWCEKNEIPISQPCIVEFPIEMSPHNLPTALDDMVPEKFKKFLNKPIDADSLNFIRKLDQIWNTDIQTAMPEWKKVFNNLYWNDFESLKALDQDLEKYVK